MPRTLFATALAASLIAPLSPLLAGVADDLGRARALLDRNDGPSAASILESALPDASGEERPLLLRELRRAYELAAKRAEDAGRAREAEAYRDNLQILSRKAGPAAKGPDASPAIEPPSGAASPALTAPVPPERLPDLGTDTPDEATPGPRPSVREEIAPADEAFRAGKYDEAGKLYSALAQRGRLPEGRRDHWAYCRCVDVVRRINAKPASASEWADIHAEIQAIRELSPKNWFGEYLRNLAAQRSAQASASKADPRQLVLRGSSPDEPGSVAPAPAARKAPRPKADAAVTPTSAPAPASAPTTAARPAARVGQPGPNQGNWQVWNTPNFRILHADAAVAERVAQVAETARDEQTRRWAGSSPPGPWSPRCDIYIYPSAALFSQMTGQPEDSPGFSTMGLNSGRIVARRLNLRADHPNMVAAVLPHEVTHVVLADLFTTQQIPRWADEGIAVLSEPASEQHLRAEDLSKPLAANQLFKVETLMKADYPDGRYWALFYAQSISLTRFLVESGDHARFIQFLQGSQRNGFEAELRRVYKIDGYADLQKRWLAYARTSASGTRTASAATASR
jgi:hypothetical protein